jgi:DNA-binding NarL/FixJ family response regulator
MKDPARAAVFLLAQNRLLREGLSRILANKNDIEVVGCGALSPDSLHDIVAAAPDVLVIESLTTNHAQLDFVREVQQNLPDLRLVMIGMDTDRQHFLQSIREGAMGYVVKDASAIEVVAAVRTVAMPAVAAAGGEQRSRRRIRVRSFGTWRVRCAKG